MLDGEVAIFDRQLRSRFDWLRDPDPEEVATPPLLMVFDLLYRAGRDQTKRPLRERRARLEEIVAGAERTFPIRRPTSNRRPSRRALPGDVRRHLVEILLQVLDLRTTLLDGDPHEIADRQHGQETVATNDG